MISTEFGSNEFGYYSTIKHLRLESFEAVETLNLRAPAKISKRELLPDEKQGELLVYRP